MIIPIAGVWHAAFLRSRRQLSKVAGDLPARGESIILGASLRGFERDRGTPVPARKKDTDRPTQGSAFTRDRSIRPNER